MDNTTKKLGHNYSTTAYKVWGADENRYMKRAMRVASHKGE